MKRVSPVYIHVLNFYNYFAARSFSAEASLMQIQKSSIALLSSSTEGYEGAILILLSSGSFPYGYVAPAPVSTTPASLQRETIRFAHPLIASNEMK